MDIDKELRDHMKSQMIAVYEIMADPQTVEAIAAMSWNLFNVLKSKGFNEDQAMQIVGRYTQGKSKE